MRKKAIPLGQARFYGENFILKDPLHVFRKIWTNFHTKTESLKFDFECAFIKIMTLNVDQKLCKAILKENDDEMGLIIVNFLC